MNHLRTSVSKYCKLHNKMARNVVVETPTGKLRGLSRNSYRGDEYHAFKGVPYAVPPVGDLRFRDPKPIEAWPGIRDALEHGPIAPQYAYDTRSVKGSEDCLYLNVYTRSLDGQGRMPVMVYLHGGAFIQRSGNDDQYGPEFLMMQEIVLVTINYRLGIFGFLDLDDKLAAGNQAFKDQVMALQWVQKNIKSFGGDPENVTVFGASAGAASVHYLALSPMAKGLFHKAIMQSGTALNPWGTKKEPLKSVHEFLELLHCNERDPKEIIEFLRTVDYAKLIETHQKFITPMAWFQCLFPFGPSVDVKSDNPFMPVPLLEAANEGIQVPLMMGFTSLEGLFTSMYVPNIDMKDLNLNFQKYIYPWISEILDHYKLTLEELRSLYFGNEEISERTLQNLIELLGDIYFSEGLHRLAKIQVKNSAAPTYLYKFTFDKNMTLVRKCLNTNIKGTTHGDELAYMFKMNVFDTSNFEQLQKGTGGERVMEQVVELWTNFAKTGRPTPETSELSPVNWKPLDDATSLRYLNIGDELRMERALNISERYSK